MLKNAQELAARPKIMHPSDIAATAVFLASPAADYITGAILNVDGGWLAR